MVTLSSSGSVTSAHFGRLIHSTSSSQIKLQTHCSTTRLLWFVTFVHVPFSFQTFDQSLTRYRKLQVNPFTPVGKITYFVKWLPQTQGPHILVVYHLKDIICGIQ